MKTPDVVIVGGGIVGLATALQLLRSKSARPIVLEAEDAVAKHQTGHNSGVIHSGLYYKPGSAKALNCVAGRAAMIRFCQEHAIPFELCGKVVVACDPSELGPLDELHRRGVANGLSGIRKLTGSEIKDLEPNVRSIAGLQVPETGIVDFGEVARTMARLISAQGGEIRTGARVVKVLDNSTGRTVETTAGPFPADRLINCGGLQCDRIARLCGLDPGLKIVPFRGEYYSLTPAAKSLVRNLIYPTPDARFPFLGVHFTRTIHGDVEAGPNAVLAFAREGYTRWTISPRDLWELASFPGFWRIAWKYWRTGAGEMYRSFSKRAFHRALARLIPELRYEDIVPFGAGVRAQAVESNGTLVDDFRFVQGPGMIHVLNAPSPAATASLSIGQTIAEMATKQFDLAASN